jgi:hypothetical protein
MTLMQGALEVIFPQKSGHIFREIMSKTWGGFYPHAPAHGSKVLKDSMFS